MSRSLSVSLTIASLCVVLAAALQAQGRQGGGRGQVHVARRRGQGNSHRDLRVVSRPQHDYRLRGVHAGRLARSDRHHGPAPRRAGSTGDAVPRHALSAEAWPRAGARARRRVSDVQGVDRSHPRSALARSAADEGRHDLVERAVHQPRRTAQSQHRRDARVRAPARLASAQHRGRCGGQHLVHGERQRDDRQARAGDRTDHRVQDARSGGARSAYGDLRQERDAVLHAAAEQHDRTAGSFDRRDQADHADDAALAALRPEAGLEGHGVGGRTTARTRSAAWIPSRWRFASSRCRRARAPDGSSSRATTWCGT